MVENIQDGVFLIQDRKIKFVNEAFAKIPGYTVEEIIGRDFREFVAPEDLEMVTDRYNRMMAEKNVVMEYEFRSIRKHEDKRTFVNMAVGLINYHGKLAALGTVKDITERKQAEEEKKKLQAKYQQAQKMEAIGTLAGGIAHDFNNLLMAIQGNVSLILSDAGSSRLHNERLNKIEQMVRRGAELTKQLLGFARGGKYEVKPTDLNELIETSFNLFGRTKKEIKIHWKYQKEIWMVKADRGQIEQVLLNLYVNAWQAMPSGGDIYIKTENVTLDENYIKPFGFKPGRYVKISITDTGIGMNEATRQRIFDPFFTTKGMGRGTGLGLASVYGIIKNHGGIINVYSAVDQGSTFNIYLPISEKEEMRQKESVREVPKGFETILLVDDEDIIIDVAKEMLETMGYNVMAASSGKEAMEIYKENLDKIDIVVLDMIMPDMGGGETYDRLKEVNPEVKVLLSSGYSINGQADEIMKRGCDGFIQKPFNMIELSAKIREVVGSTFFAEKRTG